MIKLIDILKEIKVNNPNKITIGFKDDEGVWIDEDLMLKYLLPLFPNEDQNIIDWVEELNDFGAEEEDLTTNIKQLKQDYIDSGNRKNFVDENKNGDLNEIKVNKPLTKPIIVRKGKEGITAEYYYVFKEDNPQLPDYFFGDSDGSLVKMFKTKMWINLYQAPRHIRSEKTKELTSFLNQKGIQAIQKSKYNEDIIEIPLNQIRIKIIEN